MAYDDGRFCTQLFRGCRALMGRGFVGDEMLKRASI